MSMQDCPSRLIVASTYIATAADMTMRSTQHHKDAKSRNSCVVVSSIYLADASSLRLFCLGGPLSGELLGSRLRPLPTLARASFMPLPLPLPRLPAQDLLVDVTCRDNTVDTTQYKHLSISFSTQRQHSAHYMIEACHAQP